MGNFCSLFNHDERGIGLSETLLIELDSVVGYNSVRPQHRSHLDGGFAYPRS